MFRLEIKRTMTMTMGKEKDHYECIHRISVLLLPLGMDVLSFTPTEQKDRANSREGAKDGL